MKQLSFTIIILLLFLIGCKKDESVPEDSTPSAPTAEMIFPVALANDIRADFETFFTEGDSPVIGFQKIYDLYNVDPTIEEIVMEDANMVIKLTNGMSMGFSAVIDSAGTTQTLGGVNSSSTLMKSGGSLLPKFDGRHLANINPLQGEIWPSGGSIGESLNSIMDVADAWYGDSFARTEFVDGNATYDRIDVSSEGFGGDITVLTGHGFQGMIYATGDEVVFPETDSFDQAYVDEINDPFEQEKFQLLLDGDLAITQTFRFNQLGGYIPVTNSLGTYQMGITPRYLDGIINNSKSRIFILNFCFSLKTNPTYPTFYSVLNQHDKLAYYGWTGIAGAEAAKRGTERIFIEIFIDFDETSGALEIEGYPPIEYTTNANVHGGTLVSTYFMQSAGKGDLTSCHCPEEIEVDNELYSVVQIGFQCWTTRNLDRQGFLGICYDYEDINCTQYGGLFTQAEAVNLPPEGWVVPSEIDWRTLEKKIGMLDSELIVWGGRGSVGHLLKSPWTGDSPMGTDEFGFAAKPGGNLLDGAFDFTRINEMSAFWTSTELNNTGEGMFRKLNLGTSNILRDKSSVLDKFSVRIMKMHNRP